MSADVQKKCSAPVSQVTITPTAVSDRSILDSVAGFINDVALTNVSQQDANNQILWLRFETCADISDICLKNNKSDETQSIPLLLILGFATKVQVWAIQPSGEAIEVLSWKYGLIKCLRVLPTPISFSDKDPMDQFIYKRPLIALSEIPSTTGTPSQYTNVNFVSLKDGDQVKNIRFKNAVVDIQANRSSVVITLPERIAVFDAKTLEDRLVITTCALSPGINSNPVALGSRWLAYADKKLNPTKRSSGGFDGEEIQSYTASVLSAAKTIGKGLKGLSEHVAAGLTGTSPSSSSNLFYVQPEPIQNGIVTIIDVKNQISEYSSSHSVSNHEIDPTIAHFVAHHEAVVALQFDFSGSLLLTADRKGHDFHLFRIESHPCGSALTAVHHLYVLHRGDTTAKVQDITFSMDSRWVAVSTLRGTSHVFPITPYGGSVGYRTHGAPFVVNRLSRFHRSAGITLDNRSCSPVNVSEGTSQALPAYANPRLPPFHSPTVILPSAQIRQPVNLSGTMTYNNQAKTGGTRTQYQSSNDDLNRMVRISTIFAADRSWLLNIPVRDKAAYKTAKKSTDCLFVMGSHGALIQYDLETKPTSSVPKEKICDETQIDLTVEARAQWILLTTEETAEVKPPLCKTNLLLTDVFAYQQNGTLDELNHQKDKERNDKWLSQVEITSHAGPHRRLWMGPQFTFKTYNISSGGSLSSLDIESHDIGITPASKMARLRSQSESYETPVEPKQSDGCESTSDLLKTCGEETSLHFGESVTIRDDIADAMRDVSAGNSAIDAGDSSSSSSRYGSIQNLCTIAKATPSLVNVVNPLGTVTTLSEDYLNMDNVMTVEDVNGCEELLHRSLEAAIEKSDLKKELSNEKQKTSNLNKGALVVPVMKMLSTKQEKKHFSQQDDDSNNFNNNEDKKKIAGINIGAGAGTERNRYKIDVSIKEQNQSKPDNEMKPTKEYVNNKKTNVSSGGIERRRKDVEVTSNQNHDIPEKSILIEAKKEPELVEVTNPEPITYPTKTSYRNNKTGKDRSKKNSKYDTAVETTTSESSNSNSFQALKAFDLSQIETEFPSLKPLEQLDTLAEDLDQINFDSTPSPPATKPTSTANLDDKSPTEIKSNEVQPQPKQDNSSPVDESPLTLIFNDNQENHDSDYKSLEMEETNFERMQNENTSSDENTEGSIVITNKINEDDEELRPLIVKSIKCETNVLEEEKIEAPNTTSIDLPTFNNSNLKKRSKKKRK